MFVSGVAKQLEMQEKQQFLVDIDGNNYVFCVALIDIPEKEKEYNGKKYTSKARKAGELWCYQPENGVSGVEPQPIDSLPKNLQHSLRMLATKFSKFGKK